MHLHDTAVGSCLKSVITAVNEVSPDNHLRCSMHTPPSPHCNDNHWNVCHWWLTDHPEAVAFQNQ
ncbi:hypothetical protein [Streptomyces sp. NPDC008092]|uniref:hypothetical protein n=1 Tax=Streptomyces sp. NPDC008092 TaxID=3364808 RepID=UPI0036E8B787